MEQQLAEKDGEITQKDRELRATNEQLDTKTCKLRRTENKLKEMKKSVKMPEKPKKREIFKLMCKPNEFIVAPIKRMSSTLAKRVKELKDSGFVDMHELKDLPNARYLWRYLHMVMKKQGTMNYRPQPSALTNNTIQSYFIADEIDVDMLIRDMKLNQDQAEWITNIITGAGRVPARQTRMDQFLVPMDTE